jgi:hypothetical protein
MGAADVVKTVKQNQGKKGRTKQDIYLSGYHMLGGMAASLLISKIMEYVIPDRQDRRIKKGILTGNPIENVGKGIKLDKMVMLTASAALTVGEIFFNIKGGTSAGAGMVLGYIYFDSSRSNRYVGMAKE